MYKTIGALGAPARRADDLHAPRGRASSGAAPAPATGDAPGGCGGTHQAAPRGGPADPPEAVACHLGRSTFFVHEGREARRTAGEEGVRGGTPRPTSPPQRAHGNGVPVLDKGHSISSAIMKPLTLKDVYTDGQIKINPRTGEIVEAVLASRPIFKADRYAEPRDKADRVASSDPEGDGASRAAARARRQVFELCDCNDFDLFFTLTLSPEKVDRYDYKAAVERLRVYLSNRVQRKGLRYVAVPERHQDGAIHFHGLCNAEAVGLADSGRRWKGRTVYNMDWQVGFSTAVKITGTYERVCKYITKYVTKQTEGGTIGGRYYYHGGALAHYRVQHFKGAGAPFSGHSVEVPGAALWLCYIDLKNPENMQRLGELLT